MVAILGVVTAVGIAFQLVKGTRIQLDFYLVGLFVLVGLQVMMVAVLATFLQTLVNERYAALAIVLIVVIVAPFTVEWLEVRAPLLHFANFPRCRFRT